MDVVIQKPKASISAKKGAKTAALAFLAMLVALGMALLVAGTNVLGQALTDPTTIGALLAPLLRKYPFVATVAPILLVPLITGLGESMRNWASQQKKLAESTPAEVVPMPDPLAAYEPKDSTEQQLYDTAVKTYLDVGLLFEDARKYALFKIREVRMKEASAR